MRIETNFITGLPRSRTAWMSVLLTTPTIEGFHEPSAGCLIAAKVNDETGEVIEPARLDVPRILRVPASSTKPYAVLCDTAFPSYWTKVEEILDDEPAVAIIRRNLLDVQESLMRLWEGAGLDVDAEAHWAYLLELDKQLDAMGRSHALRTLEIPFADLDSSSGVKRVWEHVAPCSPFDPSRYAKIRRLNVQAREEWLLELVKAQAAGVEA